ncbi:MAG: iron-sulfur cluster assembly protein [Thermodesulfobacteriota bacterium]|nr:iron-sulfur cluster assembly protein [Thermodesulfobacteriota bacterium]MEE2975499.1 iron-sulfur cluster assembly protein [Thermodesulfobacteriota bacterium]|tara:strand:- start:7270 stop:7578 length:309 start_codon:yes stop_codon:yes gene_type:complete
MSESLSKEKILEALSQVYDPEIPIDIVNLGLVYKVTIDNDIVNLEMTMTSPGCPSAREIIMEAQTVVSELDGVKETNIEIVWDPPWSPEKMSEEAKLSMGID